MDQELLDKIHSAVLKGMMEDMRIMGDVSNKEDEGIASVSQARGGSSARPAQRSTPGLTDQSLDALITLAESAGVAEEDLATMLREALESTGCRSSKKL